MLHCYVCYMCMLLSKHTVTLLRCAICMWWSKHIVTLLFTLPAAGCGSPEPLGLQDVGRPRDPPWQVVPVSGSPPLLRTRLWTRPSVRTTIPEHVFQTLLFCFYKVQALLFLFNPYHFQTLFPCFGNFQTPLFCLTSTVNSALPLLPLLGSLLLLDHF
jgi:hypothetical protein